MVTMSIAEPSDAIALWLRHTLTSKGFLFCRNHQKGDGNYLLLPISTQKNCDVLLLHEPRENCPPADYITILNADRKITPNQSKKSLVITYGLNSLATITASSLHAEPEFVRFHCCLQRSIVTLKGKLLEPQEFPVSLPNSLPDISTALACVSLGLVLSLPPEDFNHFL